MTDGSQAGRTAMDPLRLPATVGGGFESPGGPGALPSGRWLLESRAGSDGSLHRTPIRHLPFRLGRGVGVSLVLQSGLVSKEHAEIYSDGRGLRVRDLGSRNGTFVNHQEVADAPLRDGDVLHVGDFEFRVARESLRRALDDDPDGTNIRRAPLSRHFSPGAARAMRETLERGAVTSLFQPIVLAKGAPVIAYEALGRGAHPDLPVGPIELFEVAGTLGPDEPCRLSRLFRRRAVELARRLPQPPLLFLNTHPLELARPGLLESLGELRAFAPQVQLVLEIHESALAQPEFIQSLRESLDEMSVGLAFDDFGAGQARLFELAEVPPHYLKFDRRFVTGIDHAPLSRQRLVASLVAAARELLVSTIAEGVETAAEAATCLRAGFTHAQGNHFGLPAALEATAPDPSPGA
jgi:EAL domain-containing protein (putative c-di-GMP-specific phosphodiesterase class I)